MPARTMKVESKIEQINHLGIKMSMMHDAIHRSRNKSRGKSQTEIGQIVLVVETVSIVVKAITMVIAQHLARSVKNVGKIIISKLCAKAVKNTMLADPGQRKVKGKGSMK